ncbi:ABC transporter permease subunit [Chelativorans sp. ZYF759]|uniref:ABC transporter permease n=1 Tax=Chelativorans sp. ZYF759 TaxID=2692213 RepID=UPI00145FA41B|nr:ABC transporter permease [Chelativorans sp. ZYF759]NMG37655.1 ABC transporter permease subunit [Chelativorans sp. ZYF759]
MGADTITRTNRVTALAPWLLVLPATMAVFALLAVPVGSTLAESFSNPLGVFENYRRFFASDYNRMVVLRSFWIAFATTAIALAAGFFAAYLIAGSGPRTKRILILLSVFPLLTGVVVRSFGWMVILGRNGILNNALIELGLINAPLSLLFNQGAVLVGMVYLFLPLMILSLVGVLETIDQDLYSAAESLGSSPFGVFRQVTFPLALPGMVVGSILVFTGSLATFVTPRLLGGERQMTLATLLHEKAIISFDWEAANTIATIMIVLTALSLVALGMLAKRLSPKGRA